METKKTPLRILIFLILLINQLKGQTKDIDSLRPMRITFTITVNEAPLKDSTFKIKVNNLTQNRVNKILSKNVVTINLPFYCKYEISITHKGCNTKIIEVDTDAPYDNWLVCTSVALSTKVKGTIVAGGVKYDSSTQTFVAYLK